MMMEDNTIRAGELMDKGTLLVVFVRGMLTFRQKAIISDLYAGINTMWNYWNLLDVGRVFDAVMMLMIVLPTRVRFCQVGIL